MGAGSSINCKSSCTYDQFDEGQDSSVATQTKDDSAERDSVNGDAGEPKTDEKETKGPVPAKSASTKKPPSFGARRPPPKNGSKKAGSADKDKWLKTKIEINDIYGNEIIFYGIEATQINGEKCPEMLLLYNKKQHLADCRVLRRVQSRNKTIIEFVGLPINFELDTDKEDDTPVLALLRVKVAADEYEKIKKELDDVQEETFNQPHRKWTYAEFFDTYSEPKYVRKYFYCESAETQFCVWIYFNDTEQKWTLRVNTEVWFTGCEVVSINQKTVILNGFRHRARSPWSFDLKEEYTKEQENGILNSLYKLPRYKEIHDEPESKLIICDWGALNLGAAANSDRSSILGSPMEV